MFLADFVGVSKFCEKKKKCIKSACFCVFLFELLSLKLGIYDRNVIVFFKL